MKRIILAFATASVIAACSPGYAQAKPKAAAAAAAAAAQVDRSERCITEQEVVAAQKAWSDGIIKIGKIHAAGGDYTAAATDHINRFYGYDQGLVAFKPTLARDAQFRGSFDSALSYFVGGNPSYGEDKGFAIKGWTAVRWENAGIINNACNVALAMGNYYFTGKDGSDTKVEYTFGYTRDDKGDLKIVLHHSSVPYSGA